MEPPAQISCSGNCLIHLHSAAAKAWWDRRSYGLGKYVGRDGIPRFLLFTDNDAIKLFSAHEIRTLRFQMLLAEIEQQYGCPVRDLIAIIPAIDSDPRQYLSEIYAAGNAAGARIVASIGRSVLAASYYKSVTPGRRTVLVFELGGQFFEITLLTEDQRLNIRAVVSGFGCPFFNELVSTLQSRLGNSITSNNATVFKILTECERAKNALCFGSSTAEIKFNVLGCDMRITINRESLVWGNLNHLRRGIMWCLMEAGIGPEAVDEIVLAGASTNIPEVRQILREFFQAQPFRCSIDPANIIDVSSKRYMEIVSNRLNIPLASLLAVNMGIHPL